MRFCRLSLRHEGVLEIGRLVVSLFRRCITFCKECKLCSRWHWLRYRWNDQWSLWVAWVLIFSQRCGWKDTFCVVRLKSSGLVTCLEWHFWLKSCLCFCRVWMKLMAVAKIFYQKPAVRDYSSLFMTVRDYSRLFAVRYSSFPDMVWKKKNIFPMKKENLLKMYEP